MADETKSDRLTLEELMVSTLAMTDALAKLLIAKGIITDADALTGPVYSEREQLIR
jgi:hypothetical protein